MKKTFSLLSAALFILLLAGSALAFEQTSLVPSTWTGNVTYITAGGAVTNSYASSIGFAFESTDPTNFLSGTFTLSTPAPVSAPFSAIQDGNSLAITAANYTISASIIGHRCHHRRGGTAPPAVMTIKGRSIADGSMFEGTLTETTE
jgi:hypothetical protein